MDLIQVFSIEDKNKLLSKGYKFLLEQEMGGMKAYVFEDNKTLNFDLKEVKALRSNTLYF